MPKLFIVMGSINAFLAVSLGAFGAHALKTRLSGDMLATYLTGNQYHMYHSLGLILVGIIAHGLSQSPYLNWSGWLLMIGIILFSGSLYVLSMSGVRWLGAITPLGGIAFLAGWILLATAVIKDM